jgi:single-stranded-DNA-specific exonuclease
LDSIIAPSALNEEFYSEIERLAPFGSGNSEPKFVIENLQVITSDLVADKHIKTVFYAKDGSVIKSIAFNAKDSPLELYLNKKNKKKFNIAGIMNLNEWRGKKSVEFIIEDISLH